VTNDQPTVLRGWGQQGFVDLGVALSDWRGPASLDRGMNHVGHEYREGLLTGPRETGLLSA
jgi:hypothetical protein